jgi:hypothetical protein
MTSWIFSLAGPSSYPHWITFRAFYLLRSRDLVTSKGVRTGIESLTIVSCGCIDVLIQECCEGTTVRRNPGA